MKKTLLSLGMLTFVTAAAIGGTGAFFSDEVTSEDNVFTAGDVTLTNGSVDHTYNGSGAESPIFTPEGFTFTLADLKPADEGLIEYDLTNGSNEATVCVMIEETGNHDNGRNNPELNAGDPDDGNGNGELGDFLSFSFGGQSGLLTDISGVWQTVGVISGAGSVLQDIDYCFGEFDNGACEVDEEAEYNLAQTDSLDASVTFYAEQTRNNDFVCEELNNFADGFEEDEENWIDFPGPWSRVTSGTNGIDSASGDFHASVEGPIFTRWGGYSDEFPIGGYTTEVDVYLDMDEVTSDDDYFEFSVASNGSDGNHQRDFIFHVGHDSANNAWSATVSNNSNWTQSNPQASTPHLVPQKSGTVNPVSITTTGWYTLQSHFRDDGGVLAVDMNILDDMGNTVATWTLSNPTDTIPAEVGGNRYGWFVQQPFSFLAIDNGQRYLGAPN